MKRTSILVLCAAALAVCMMSNTAHATVIYAADFNSAGNHSGDFTSSANYTDGGLIGQDSWTTQSASANPLTVAGASPNGCVAMANNGQDAQATFTAQTSGTVYFSADINLSAVASTTGDYFMNLGNSTTEYFL